MRAVVGGYRDALNVGIDPLTGGIFDLRERQFCSDRIGLFDIRDCAGSVAQRSVRP